jgi:hypothetical protein
MIDDMHKRAAATEKKELVGRLLFLYITAHQRETTITFFLSTNEVEEKKTVKKEKTSS